MAGTVIAGYTGDAGPATSAQLYMPAAVAVDAAGNLYIADQFNHRIRRVAADGTITTVAGNGTNGYSGDAGSATSAELSYPCGVAVDAAGNLYIGDTGNHVVRKVAASGTITTVAGKNESGYSGDTAAATSAQLNHPSGVALDAVGTLYIADTGNHVIRKVASDGTITTVAGDGTKGSSGMGGLATKAELNNPESVAVDAAGNLYIGDTGSHAVRKVLVNGTIRTVAGTGTGGYSGDGGPATSAQLYYPKGVRVDAAGNLYVADCLNNRIRMVTASGTITTVAGAGGAGFWGDGGPATIALLSAPSDVALDAAGNIYIDDTGNSSIRLLTPAPQFPAINAGGVVGAGSFGAFASAAPGSWIEIYGSNLAANSRRWTAADFNGVNAPTSLDGTKVTIGGQAAFIGYISPGQVNAQVPSNVWPGSQQVTVTTALGTSAPATIRVNPAQPGLYAPPSFKIGGKQYVAALFPDNVTYVLPPGAIAGIPSRQAQPGDTIILYGVGFGSVTPSIPAGQVVQQNNALVSPFNVFFGQTQATAVSYSGLAPSAIGLYQFNVVVPNVAASDAVPLTFTLGGASGTQTLYTAVRN